MQPQDKILKALDGLSYRQAVHQLFQSMKNVTASAGDAKVKNTIADWLEAYATELRQ